MEKMLAVVLKAGDRPTALSLHIFIRGFRRHINGGGVGGGLILNRNRKTTLKQAIAVLIKIHFAPMGF